ncbi:MAG: type II toxin-antitoxin system RelE/ParE family toxin [Bacteroidales bacterium]|nr:type II toxin-antitoxin system RelE/ParE family toxin [Bacteroidales bacterium]
MEIITTEEFKRCAKPLAKRYKSFNQDYQALLDELERNPQLGTDLGMGYRKVRMAIKSKGKGKSGGARVITLDTLECDGYLYLLYIYDKSDSDNVDLDIIKKIVSKMNL